MPDRTSGAGQDDERAAASASGMPGSAAGSGAVRPENLDWQALLDGLAASGFLGGTIEDQDAVLAEEIAAAEEGPDGAAALCRRADGGAGGRAYGSGPGAGGVAGSGRRPGGAADENALAGMLAGAQKLARGARRWG